MLLSKLFKDAPEVEATGVALDSRKVEKGNIFFCIKGLTTDGHRFAAMAREKGAACIVHSDPVEEMDGTVYVQVPDTLIELNRVCDLFYGRPSSKLEVFSVTGTDGKSTTTNIIRDVYHKPCGYMGTIAVRYGDFSRPANLTTPDPVELHSTLKEMVDHGMEAVSIEVSSQGLDLHRTDTVDFDVAVFTKFSAEHLDYHKTMEQYFEAKKLLFRQMKPEGVAVLNVDDISFEELAECTACRYVTYGIEKDADYRAEDLDLYIGGTAFTLVHDGKRYPVRTNLCAKYNIYNLLGAIAAMHEMGMEIEDMLPRLEKISQVDGRMELIDKGQDFTVIVDYAHTPDGYVKFFDYVKKIADGNNIYAVFGCSGRRDKSNRKVRGHLAGGYCTTVFLTEEDPRDEKVEDISRMVLAGMEKGNGVMIEDRYEAIETAIRTAKTGDCVVILGKGDEQYLDYEDGKHFWMGDNVAAAKALEKIMSEK